MMDDGQSGGTYLCSKCGQLKKGHTCPAVATRAVTENLPLMMGVLPSTGITTRRTYNQNMQMVQQLQQQHQQIPIQPGVVVPGQQMVVPSTNVVQPQPMPMPILQPQVPVHSQVVAAHPQMVQQQMQQMQMQQQMVAQQQMQQQMAQQQQIQLQMAQQQMQQQIAQQQMQQQLQQNPMLMQHMMSQLHGGFGGLPPTGLTPDQKRAREKAAADFNMWFLLERQERYPYYFDPHTKTIQVIGSWYINVSDAWNDMTAQEKQILLSKTQRMASHRHLFLQRQHDIQSLQAEIQKKQATLAKEEKKSLIAKQMREKQIEELKERIQRPKTNVQAFFHYLNDNRENEKRSQPDLSLADISKVLGQRWKGMLDEEKQPYAQKATDDKVRFEAEMIDYRNRIQEATDNLPPIDLSTIPDPEEPPTPQPQPPAQQQPQQPQAPPPGAEKRCETCGQPDNNKDQTLSCISCLRIYHTKCLQLSQLAIDTIKKSGNWKCIDCKLCDVCNEGGNEEKMMFCDVCDKGYHTFCCSPKMDTPPVGGWKCNSCVHCIHCGSKIPGAMSNAKWRGNYTSCENCWTKVEDKKYCTVCRKVMKIGEKKPTIQCVHCERWTHASCDSISNEMLEKMKDNHSLQYKCQTCKSGSFASSVTKSQKIKPIIDSDDEQDNDSEEEDTPPPTTSSSSKRKSLLAAEEKIANTKRGDRKKRKKREPKQEDDDEEEEVDDVNVDE